MTGDARLRAVLERAADNAPTLAGTSEARVRAAASRHRRVRRRIAVVGLCAATAAVAAVAVVTPRLLSESNGQRSHPVVQPLTVGPVGAGEYLLDSTRPRERVTLGPGWTVTVATTGDARLGRRDSSGVLGFGVVTKVYVPKVATRTTTVRDLTGWLKGHPDLRLVSSHVVRIDGFVGIDLAVRVVAQPSTVDPSCAVTCVPLFSLPSGAVDVAAGGTLHVIVINEAGRTVVAYSSATAQDYETWSTSADRVLASLRLA